MQMVKGRKYRPHNQEEYQALEKRVNAGVQFLEGRWFDPTYRREVAHFMEMACSLLDYDIATGTVDKCIQEQMKGRNDTKRSIRGTV